MNNPGTVGLLAGLSYDVIAIALLLYLVPSVVAFARLHRNRYPVLVLNVAFGWTGMGWIGVLVWAVWATRTAPETDAFSKEWSRLDRFVDQSHAMRRQGSLELPGAVALIATARLSTAEVVDELDRLNALRAAGDLSDDEFAELKAVALRRVRRQG